MTQHIACSPLTGHIFMGRINAKQGSFVGEKRDVTSEVLGALIEKAEFHGGSFDIQRQDGKRWIVSVQLEGSATESAEPMTRYCPDCGHIGPVSEGARDCCPDGDHARVIPSVLAKKCRATFMRTLS